MLIRTCTADRIAPVNVTNGGHTDLDLTANHTVNYQLTWQNATAPRGFFIDGKSGEMLLQVPSTPGFYLAAVEAHFPGTTAKKMYNITFDLRPADTTRTTNGPNGRDCFGGSSQRVDTVEFDFAYTCDCPGGTTGDNCDPVAAAATSPATANATLAYGISASLILLILLVLILIALKVRRQRLSPVDMTDMQNEILAALGMGGAALNIDKNEVGISFLFDDSLKTRAADVTANVSIQDRFEEDLLATLRKLPNLPYRLTTLLKQESTAVTLNVPEGTALLRMKKPKNYALKPGSEDAYVAALQARADQKPYGLEGRHWVVEVSVAVPKRVPAELDRRSVTRLGPLGEGNYGEVFKARITSNSRGGVALTAAVKTMKSTDINVRSELLREAALMALFEHPHLVALIGVVS